MHGLRPEYTLRGKSDDHTAFKCRLKVTKPAATKKTLCFRKFKDLDVNAFCEDIKASPLVNTPADTMDGLVEQYNDTLAGLVDLHAPKMTKTFSLRPHAPWYTDSLRDAKRHKRRLERRMLKSGLQVDKLAFKEQCKQYHSMLDSVKTDHHRSEIAGCNSKQLFRTINKLCGFKPATVLPSGEEIDVAERFGEYFTGKIAAIRSDLDNAETTPVVLTHQRSSPAPLCQFQELSEQEVRKTVMDMPTKSCALDPLPTWLLKRCIDHVLPLLTKTVNFSLSMGYVPDCMKVARVTPIIKKASLDPEVMSNYRPVSNLSFISKLNERIVCRQLQEHLTASNLYAPHQSAYRPNCSTETALLRLQNDLLCALDNRKDAVLVLLDLSAAFDTLDHKMLLERMKSRYGVKNTALKWFESYLSDRVQSVAVGSKLSCTHKLIYGVPQGSVVGPSKFTMYSAPLEDVISAHDINVLSYADDTQLYCSFYPDDRESVISQLEGCIADVKGWLSANKLKLNDNKTEVIHITSRFRTTEPINPIVIGNSAISPSDAARNLGVIFDKHMSMKAHVNKLCQSASFALRAIGQIRHYLDRASAEKLVHAFVTSRLDYCNSLLYGLPDKLINKLQRVQNSAARLVTRSKKRNHISHILQDLHWLPVKKRIVFKILLIVFKSLNNAAPSYMSELLKPYRPTVSLRSGSRMLLVVPNSNLKSFGDRSFSYVGPKIWNTLPMNLRTAGSVQEFKSGLKTYLFNLDI